MRRTLIAAQHPPGCFVFGNGAAAVSSSFSPPRSKNFGQPKLGEICRGAIDPLIVKALDNAVADVLAELQFELCRMPIVWARDFRSLLRSRLTERVGFPVPVLQLGTGSLHISSIFQYNPS